MSQRRCAQQFTASAADKTKSLGCVTALPCEVCIALPQVLQLLAVDHAGGTSEWALANVRANRGQGRAKLSSHMARERWTLPLSALQRVNLYLDM